MIEIELNRGELDCAVAQWYELMPECVVATWTLFVHRGKLVASGRGHLYQLDGFEELLPGVEENHSSALVGAGTDESPGRWNIRTLLDVFRFRPMFLSDLPTDMREQVISLMVARELSDRLTGED